MHGFKLHWKMIISNSLGMKGWVHLSDLFDFGSRQLLLLDLELFVLLISEGVKNGLLDGYYDVIRDFRRPDLQHLQGL
jgi:hypothetical protein